MKADRIDLGLTGYDELFMSTEERLDAKKPKVDELPLDELKPFKGHPFKVMEDEEMERLKESIRESGVLIPALARPTESGYELISGHRRLAACRALGMSTMPVIVRKLTDEEAIITMVDSNLQREHIFCDILRCADCGSKMWYHTNTQNKDIHYFSCSNYVKDYRGTCLTRHYIRADAVEAVVEMELRRLAEYLVADENRFAEILARKSNKQYESEKKAAASELRKSEMRIEMIPRLLKSLYEDKLSGKTSEENYSILSSEYADEREQLKKKILKLRKKLAEMGEKESEREEFIRAIRKFMEMRTLTKQVLNELIDHIDVYETQGTGKNKTQRLVIYYKFVGYLDIDPTRCHPNYTADIREGVAVEYVSCEPSEGMKELFPEQYGVDDDSFEEEETEQA